MLTKKVARGFSPALNYPTYMYISKSGKGEKGRYDMGRIIPTPKGFREVIKYHNEDEHFTDYLKWIEEEHQRHSDNSMKAHPYGIFIGAWRNARWEDETKRRGLS